MTYPKSPTDEAEALEYAATMAEIHGKPWIAIERVFNDGLAMGFDLSNKLKLINEHTDQKVNFYSPEVWDEYGDFYVDALLKRNRKLDQEFFQKVDEAIDKLPVSDILDE
jgi:hypothetical protein